MRLHTFLVALACAQPLQANEANSPKAAQTRSVMHSIFSPITTLLPLSINGADFADEKNRAHIQKQVDLLAANAAALESHAQGQNPGFQFLSHGLARDAAEVKTWFDLKRYDEARFVLHNVTEYCISCHTKAESKQSFPGADAFFSKVDVKKLPLIERAQLLVATRQFDEGLAAYEKFFLSEKYTPAEMALMHAFSDYLKVAIRVKRDLKRPIPVLESWSKRPGVPQYMLKQVNEWISALKQIESKGLLRPPAMQHARELVSLGKDRGRLVLDRDKLVYFIAASAQLDLVINMDGTKASEYAEAFYLLGLSESVIGRSFWVSQTEFYLEAAIRAAPGSTTAMRAYQELEEQIESEYSGSSGTHIPSEVATRLGLLKKLAFKGKA